MILRIAQKCNFFATKEVRARNIDLPARQITARNNSGGNFLSFADAWGR
jgi:hypothetical protein